jgi:hypothetical protein
MHITVLKCSVPEQPITITNKPAATSETYPARARGCR